MNGTIKWAIKRLPSNAGYEGFITLPGGIKASAPGKSKAQAVARAAGIAEKIINDPILRSVLPPQAGVALKATKLLAAGIKSGAVGKVVGKLKSPTLRKLAKSLF